MTCFSIKVDIRNFKSTIHESGFEIICLNKFNGHLGVINVKCDFYSQEIYPADTYDVYNQYLINTVDKFECYVLDKKWYVINE